MDNNQFNNYDNNSGNNNRGPGNGGNNNNNGNNGKDPKKQSLLIMLVAALISLLCISYFMRTLTDVTNHEITYNQFLQMIDEGKVESVKIESSQIIITPK